MTTGVGLHVLFFQTGVMCVHDKPPVLGYVWPFATPGWQPTRLLSPWDSPGKNTGVGCRSLLQGIFPSQELNLCLLRWQAGSLPRGPPRQLRLLSLPSLSHF